MSQDYGSARPTKGAYERVVLQSSTTETSSDNATAVKMATAQAFAFVLDVTADESTAADKLDVFVQTKLDGTNWVDVVHFTQHDGNVGAARYVMKISAHIAEAGFEVGSALAENTVRHLMGDEWRARWAITDDSGSASYTFSVAGVPM